MYPLVSVTQYSHILWKSSAFDFVSYFNFCIFRESYLIFLSSGLLGSVSIAQIMLYLLEGNTSMVGKESTINQIVPEIALSVDAPRITEMTSLQTSANVDPAATTLSQILNKDSSRPVGSVSSLSRQQPPVPEACASSSTPSPRSEEQRSNDEDATKILKRTESPEAPVHNGLLHAEVD